LQIRVGGAGAEDVHPPALNFARFALRIQTSPEGEVKDHGHPHV
jgi:hypothetical protein